MKTRKLRSGIILSTGLLLVAGCSLVDRRPVPDASRAEFPDFQLKTLAGETKTLSDVLGDATMVNFFFPTCGPCNAEFPHLQAIYEKYKDKGLSMVAINTIPEQAEMVPGWQQEHGYTIPVLLGADPEALVGNYELRGTPLNYVLDRQGGIAYRREGYLPGLEFKIEEKIRKELGLD